MKTEKNFLPEKNRIVYRLSILSLFLAAFTWGSAFLVLRDTLDVFPPVWLLFFRFCLSAVILFFICIPRLGKMTAHTWKSGVRMGMILYFEFWFFTVGLQYTTSSKSAFILASYIVILPLVYWIIRKKRPQRDDILASVICMAGLSLILFGSFEGVNRGDVLSLVSAVCYALHIVMTGIYAKESDPILLNLVQIGTGAAFGLVFAVFSGTVPDGLKVSDFWGIGYLAVFSTIVPYLLSVFGQKHVRTSTSGIILSFESVFGCLLSVVVLGERPGVRFLFGAVLMMLSFFAAEGVLPGSYGSNAA